MKNESNAQHPIDVEQSKFSFTGRSLWSILIGILIMTTAANYQLFSINSRVSVLENRSKNLVNTFALEDITVYTHNSNRVAIMTESEIRGIVQDINRRYMNIY